VRDDLRLTTLVYCRCSTRKQQENLERQVGRVLEFCCANGWKVELFKDIGSGLNENRKFFKKLLKRIPEEDVRRVVVEYKDRISRYGFETFCSFCESYGVDVVVIETDEEKDFEQELAEDMISLVTSYSARLYGRRGGRRKKNDK
jgi:putative resolvase